MTGIEFTNLERRVKAIEDSDKTLIQSEAESIIDLQRRMKRIEDIIINAVREKLP